MRRVVVTGMGLVTPLGCGLEHPWGRLLNAESGIGAIQKFDTSDLPAKIAGSRTSSVNACRIGASGSFALPPTIAARASFQMESPKPL